MVLEGGCRGGKDDPFIIRIPHLRKGTEQDLVRQTALRARMSMRDLLVYYVDGGVLERNPSPHGVYFSVQRRTSAHTPYVQRTIVATRFVVTDFRTNQDAEWLAVRYALWNAADHGPPGTDVLVFTDSRFVVRQWSGRYRIKIERHKRLQMHCMGYAKKLGRVVLLWRPREVMVGVLGH